MFWPALPLAAMAIAPPEPDWSDKKRLVRERLHVLHDAGNQLYRLDAPFPQWTWDRRPQAHGAYDRDWQRIELDLESAHNKWPHLYNVTLAHEMAHRYAGLLGYPKGHGDEWRGIFETFQNHQGLLDGVQ